MFVDMCGKNFFGYVRKNIFGDLPPTILGKKILMLSLPVRANYTVPPPQK
jgi:hypothetical protein